MLRDLGTVECMLPTNAYDSTLKYSQKLGYKHVVAFTIMCLCLLSLVPYKGMWCSQIMWKYI